MTVESKQKKIGQIVCLGVNIFPLALFLYDTQNVLGKSYATLMVLQIVKLNTKQYFRNDQFNTYLA